MLFRCLYQLISIILSGIPLRCQTVLDPEQARHFVGPDLGPNCLQRLSADYTRRQRVNCYCRIFLTLKFKGIDLC